MPPEQLQTSKSLPKLIAGAVVALVVVALDVAYTTERSVGSEYPNRRITIVVPFSQGGGSDRFARIIKRAIEENDLLPVPIVVQNVPGAGATIGSQRVKDKRPDGYTLLLLHEAIITAKYAGNAAYGPEAFEPIAGTGKMGIVIAVRADSEFQSLQDLMKFTESHPQKVKYAANLDTPSHFAGLLLEQEYANITKATKGTLPAQFVFAQVGGGGDRLRALLGKQAAVTAFSIEEYVRYQPDVRGLAIFTPERHPAAAEMPTSYEQGYPISSINMQFWWAPKGTAPERIDFLAEVIRKAMETPYVRVELAKSHTHPIFVRGTEMQHEIAIREQAIQSVDLRDTTPLPNIPRMVLWITAALGIGVAVQQLRRPAGRKAWPASSDVKRTLTGVVILIVYPLLLALPFVEFRVATFVAVTSLGFVLSNWNWKNLPACGLLGVIVSSGIHFLFVVVFLVELP